MRPSLKALRSRASARARHAAEGDGPPAGQELPHPDDFGRPGAVERGTMRRRLRRARRFREALLTELGALVMEMHRQRRHDPALVDRKAREALAADREAAGLARALRAEVTMRQVVAAGIAGSCWSCGALIATDDRFCGRCGTPAIARNGPAQAIAPAAAAGPPPDPDTRHSAAVGTPSAPPPHPGTRATAPVMGRPAAPPPDPSTRAPGTAGGPAGAAAPHPRTRFPAPPDPRTRIPAPADPRTRIPTRPSPSAAPPPPDPSTRVAPPDGDTTVQMATGTTPT